MQKPPANKEVKRIRDGGSSFDEKSSNPPLSKAGGGKTEEVPILEYAEVINLPKILGHRSRS